MQKDSPMLALRCFPPTLVACALALAGCGETPPALSTVEALGAALFEDPALSLNRNQSCATCHDPDRAFTDGRTDAEGRVRAVSLGDDERSLGDRNAPTVSYAAFGPRFVLEDQRQRFNNHGRFRRYEGPRGGFFWDGRADTLADQAKGPPLNPIEMGMVDEASVVARLRANPDYAEAFPALFEGFDWDDPIAAYDAMGFAIEAFERTPEVSPFDARYDRSLRGEETLSFLELTGKSLFFSEFTSCAICHQLHGDGDPVRRFEETFTGYEFHNLGAPANQEVRSLTGVTVDDGLAAETGDPDHLGLHKVPTLRNVAVTGPFMHNGVFRELETVVRFYLRFIDPEGNGDNPETGQPWRAPEHPSTVAEDLLRAGRPLSDLEVEAIVCFMRTLTDRRYEGLLEPRPSCED